MLSLAVIPQEEQPKLIAKIGEVGTEIGRDNNGIQIKTESGRTLTVPYGIANLILKRIDYLSYPILFPCSRNQEALTSTAPGYSYEIV